MKNKFKVFLVCLMLLPFVAIAQTSKEEVFEDINKAGGVYYAYPVTESKNTLPPKGYEPFYISHYGRHGSRYLISDNDYKWVTALMHKAKDANALTSYGEEILSRLDSLTEEVEGRGGDLSPLGVKQQRLIAERMFKSYPAAFKGSNKISARSTIVVRCVLSMDAVCERLKELNPKLNITREASERYMSYLNYHSIESQEYMDEDAPWREEYRKFDLACTHPERMSKALFSDESFVTRNVNPHDLMWGFYWIAVGMQDVETPVSFMDVFTKEELFDLWQSFNYRFYVGDGNYAGNNGMMLNNAKPLLRNIIESADKYIQSGESGATLRFGHDGNLIPLAGLLRLENCYNKTDKPEDFYKNFADFKIAPMAGNIQIVFFKNKKEGNVIVKFMLNEREISIPLETPIYPFYEWQAVKKYYEDNIL